MTDLGLDEGSSSDDCHHILVTNSTTDKSTHRVVKRRFDYSANMLLTDINTVFLRASRAQVRVSFQGMDGNTHARIEY